LRADRRCGVCAAGHADRAGRVLDVRSGAYANHQGIIVENGRIREIGDFAGVRARAPQDAVAIDLRTATVLPGLINCHAHLLIAT
jgi:imidazolonepropionase-like amidohydrolase